MLNIRISKKKTHDFESACFHGYFGTIEFLLNSRHWSFPDINAHDYRGFRNACEYGHLDILELIIQDKRFTCCAQDMLDIALTSEKLDSVLFILYKIPAINYDRKLWEKHILFTLDHVEVLKYCLATSPENIELFISQALKHHRPTALHYIYENKLVDADTLKHKMLSDLTSAAKWNDDSIIRYICAFPGIQDEPTFRQRLDQVWLKYLHYHNADALSYLSFSPELSYHPFISVLPSGKLFSEDKSIWESILKNKDIAMATWYFKIFKTHYPMEYIENLASFKELCKEKFYMEKFKEVEDFLPLNDEKLVGEVALIF